MTATATEDEVREIKECLGLKDVVVLRASPVQEHFKFLALRRPSNNCGFDGDTDKNGRFHPGLSSILNRLYLNKFIECLMAGIEPKKCIIFFRTEMQLLAAYEDLQEKLPQFSDNESIPFVMNHGGVGEATEQNIVLRRNSIKLFLTTSKMLMGIDLDDINIVIFVRPPNKLHHILQGAGRAGRRRADGGRQKVLVYVLYNSQDLGGNVPGLEDSVRYFCTAQSCLKNLLRVHFDGFIPENVTGAWCCGSCDNCLMEENATT